MSGRCEQLAAPVPKSRMLGAGKECVFAYNRTREVFLATEVVVADTFWRRLIGLLGQPPSWSGEQNGLWIVPSRGVHMLGMRFAIDVVFLDREKVVLHLEENLRPWSVSHVVAAARSVLELPANVIATTKTSVGDKIEIKSARKHAWIPAKMR